MSKTVEGEIKFNSKLHRNRIAMLKKWRREIGYEFENFPQFYTSAWFINQMKQIDTLLEILEDENKYNQYISNNK